MAMTPERWQQIEKICRSALELEESQQAFSLVKDGIYFIPEPGDEGKFFIQFLSFATGKVNTVAPVSGWPSEGLSLSPDGRFLLFSHFDEGGSDLMLVENFR